MERGRKAMISVVACTNRKEFAPRMIENFRKQTLADKELILILNSPDIDVVADGQVKILSFSKDVSLGECLNRGAQAAKYDYIAKIDDDDYYGADYLKEAYEALVSTGADVAGKSSFYVYFKKNHELRLYNPNCENRWITDSGTYRSSYFLSGATLVFKKEIFGKVSFPHVNLGEDSSFQRLCFEKGMKMYSLSKEHYAYIRYQEPQHHHSDASDALLKRKSQFAASVSSIEDFFKK